MHNINEIIDVEGGEVLIRRYGVWGRVVPLTKIRLVHEIGVL